MVPRAQVVYKSVVAHMEFAARKEPPGEGKDLLDVDCIIYKAEMTPGWENLMS